MKHRIKSIAIPAPCTEDWSNMLPDAKGRFCSSCQKAVTDFSDMTNAEILAVLSVSGNICGKFGPGQISELNYELSRERGVSFSWKKFSIAAAFIGVFPFVKASAQVKPATEQHPKPQNKTAGILGLFLSSVKGKVIDHGSQEPIAGAMICLKGTNQVVFTDNTGHFKIDGITSNDSIIVCSYLGHITQEIKISQAKFFCTVELKAIELPNIPINCNSLTVTLGGISITGVNIKDRSDETERLIREIFKY
jgi:hypothetical protein